MKIDCGKTEYYFKEKARMTNECGIDCVNCPLASENSGYFADCTSFEVIYHRKAIEIVQNWSDEHPKKTWADKLSEALPNMTEYSRKAIMCDFQPIW